MIRASWRDRLPWPGRANVQPSFAAHVRARMASPEQDFAPLADKYAVRDFALAFGDLIFLAALLMVVGSRLGAVGAGVVVTRYLDT